MRYFSLAIFVLLTAANQALAAGYGLKEYSADAMAVAYAGSAATGTDASYLAYNPSSLADVSQFDVSMSAVSIMPGSQADYTTAATTPGLPASGSLTPKNFVGSAIVPEFGLRYRLSDRWAAGFVVFAPVGMKTGYPDDWAGRYYAEKTQILAIDASPTLSYQISPRISVGAALRVEYAKGALTSAIDLGTLGALYHIPGSHPGMQDGQGTFHAASWGVGYTLGTTAQLDDQLTLGLSYRSAVHHVLRGPLTFALDNSGIGAVLRGATGLFTDTRAKAPMTMPDVVALGARDRVSDRWTLLAEVDWTNWSRFRELRVIAENPAQPDDVTAANWGSGWFGSLGADYRVDERWHLRTGVGYDSSPIPSSTLDPRIPDANRLWASVGGRYQISDAATVNLTLSELFNSDKSISQSPLQGGNALRGTLAGKTTSSVTVIGFQVSYREP